MIHELFMNLLMTNSCSINDNSCSKVNKEIGKNKQEFNSEMNGVLRNEFEELKRILATNWKNNIIRKIRTH